MKKVPYKMTAYEFAEALSNLIWENWGDKINVLGGPGKDDELIIDMKENDTFMVTVERFDKTEEGV